MKISEVNKTFINIVLRSSNVMKFVATIYTIIGMNQVVIGRKRGNKLMRKSVFMKRCKIVIKGYNNSICFEEGVRLCDCKVNVCGNNNIVYIKRRASAELLEIYIEDDKNSIIIGEHTGFCGNVHIACTEGTNVSIGKECLFSAGIYIRTGDSHSIYDLTNTRINPAANVTINDNVWVGNDVKILKGAGIGANSVVATGAIVTKNYKDSNVILGGIPAKIIKRDICWNHQRV